MNGSWDDVTNRLLGLSVADALLNESVLHANRFQGQVEDVWNCFENASGSAPTTSHVPRTPDRDWTGVSKWRQSRPLWCADAHDPLLDNRPGTGCHENYLGEQPVSTIQWVTSRSGHGTAYLQRFRRGTWSLASMGHVDTVVVCEDCNLVEDLILVIRHYLGAGANEYWTAQEPKVPNAVKCTIGQVARALDHAGSIQAIEWDTKSNNDLDYAHWKEIVPRDVKPGNGLWDANGKALLIDSGPVETFEPSTQLIKTREIGIPTYVAWGQKERTKTDSSVHVYSLEMMLYETLTQYKPRDIDMLVVMGNPALELPGFLQAKHPGLLDRLVRQVLTAVHAIGDEQPRARVLVALVSHMAELSHSEALLAVAQGIDSDRWQAVGRISLGLFVGDGSTELSRVSDLLWSGQNLEAHNVRWVLCWVPEQMLGPVQLQDLLGCGELQRTVHRDVKPSNAQPDVGRGIAGANTGTADPTSANSVAQELSLDRGTYACTYGYTGTPAPTSTPTAPSLLASTITCTSMEIPIAVPHSKRTLIYRLKPTKIRTRVRSFRLASGSLCRSRCLLSRYAGLVQAGQRHSNLWQDAFRESGRAGAQVI